MPVKSARSRAAAGLAVASTDVGDVRTMLAPENASFIAPLDDDALAGSLLALLRDPAEQVRIAAGGYHVAATHYNEQTRRRELVKMLERLLTEIA